MDEKYLKDLGFELTFEDFWEEVEAFAKQNRLPTCYVEEEFIIDGEFLPLHLTWQEDLDEEPGGESPWMSTESLDAFVDHANRIEEEESKEWDDPLM